MTRRQAVHAPGIPCGLPSPGSRRQSTGFFGGKRDVMHPAQVEQALVAQPGELVTCRRCRRGIK